MSLSLLQAANLRARYEAAKVTGQYRKPGARLYLVKWPGGARQRYYIALKQGLDRIETLARESLLPRVNAALKAAAAQRTDAPNDDIDRAFGDMREAVAAELTDTRSLRLGVQAAAETASQNRQEAGRVFASLIGFDPIGAEPYLEAPLNAFAREQVRLIGGLHGTVIDQLQQTVVNALRSGQRVENLAREITERFGVARSRADLIAQDQIGKLNGELTRLRQQHVGVKRYRWSTSQDERVRPMHHALNQTEHKWDDPPITARNGARNHPGHDYRCRCVAIPIVDDILAALSGEPENDQSKPQARMRKPRSARESRFQAMANGFSQRAVDGGQSARRAAREVLSRYKMPRADRPQQDRLVVEAMPERGYHNGAGKVAVNPSVDGEAASAFASGGRNLTEAQRMAIKTVMHEEIHGYGLSPFGRAYHRHGKLVEEVATEILARRSSRQVLGLRATPSTYQFPTRGPQGWIVDHARSGYDGWIAAVAESLESVTEWPATRVTRALDRAALRYKRTPPAEGQTPDTLLEAFVNGIPGMQTVQRRALIERLRGEATRRRIDAMTLSERLYVLPPYDRDAALALARTWLDEAGDLPEGAYQTLCMTQHEPGEMMRTLTALREAHFRKLGKALPAYSGMLE